MTTEENSTSVLIDYLTSFSAFPTQLNQQVTSANLSEIGVMQRLLKVKTRITGIADGFLSAWLLALQVPLSKMHRPKKSP